MNAIIGDNGIITRAQEANIQSSIASLEEFLQLKYTENYEEMAEYQSKIEGLTNVCSSYFFIPVDEGWGGLRYVLDSEGHALYLIKKSGLPEEIRESLVGGDAGAGQYPDYSTLNDVYGVTSNLKVYYCSGGVDSIKGLAKENLDDDDPNRPVLDSTNNSSFYESLKSYDKTNDGVITVEEAKNIIEFTIDTNSGVNSLKDLYNFINLEKLTLDSVTLTDLNGLGSCAKLNYLELKNYGNASATISNYDGISIVKNLEYLYLNNSNNNQVNQVFNAIKNTDFKNLQYLGIMNGNEKITDISVLTNLSDVTKNGVKYMYLYNNSFADLTPISEYVNLMELNISGNKKITTLSASKKMINIVRIDADNCDLGKGEEYDPSLENSGKNESIDSLSSLVNNVHLVRLALRNNSNLKWVSYIKDCNELGELYLSGCSSLVGSDVRQIADLYNSLDYPLRNIDEKYSKYLSTDVRLIYGNQNLKDDSEELELLKNNLECKQLDLSRNSELSNSRLQEVLKTMVNVEYLNLNGLKNLSSIDFVKYMPNLVELLIEDTSVIDISELDNKCTHLASLQINNDSIDLTTVQNMISRMYDNKITYFSQNLTVTGINGVWGLILRSETLWKSLEECTEITQLAMGQGGYTDDFGTCDLSRSKLKKFNSYHIRVRITFPSSMIYFNCAFPEFGMDFDLSLCSLITNYDNNDFATGSQEAFDCSIKSLATLPNLKDLILRNMMSKYNLSALNENSFASLQNLTLDGGSEGRKYLYDLSGIETLNSTLKSLTLSKTSDTLLDFSPVGELTNLEALTIIDTKLADDNFIGSLTKLSTLNLSNNKVHSCVPFKTLLNLTSLNLTNNLISDTSRY